MKEKFSLKDALFNQEKVHKIALEIESVYTDFNSMGYVNDVMAEFPELELKERMYHMRDMFKKYLPDNYIEATTILLSALPPMLDPLKIDDDFGDFIYAPYSEYVVAYGCTDEHIDLSLKALREMTKRFSVEFTIREFINIYPKETMAMLEACALSDNYHERRLASEGLRPKLPWAKKLTLDYRSACKYLDYLYADNTRYVTRSVANHLNDIAKIDASFVIETLERWKDSNKQDPKEMEYIVSHALRTLVKQGNEEALALLGYIKEPKIVVSDLDVLSKVVSIGEVLVFHTLIEAKEETKLMVDYIIHFKTKLGALSPKVHKLKKLNLKKGESITLKKKHLFKENMSTRTLYEGEHKIELQINGTLYASETFILKSK